MTTIFDTVKIARGRIDPYSQAIFDNHNRQVAHYSTSNGDIFDDTKFNMASVNLNTGIISSNGEIIGRVDYLGERILNNFNSVVGTAPGIKSEVETVLVEAFGNIELDPAFLRDAEVVCLGAAGYAILKINL
jgi:hypothetical protein